jgi:hypothetical protein
VRFTAKQKLRISHFALSQEGANIPIVQLGAVHGSLIRAKRQRQ